MSTDWTAPRPNEIWFDGYLEGTVPDSADLVVTTLVTDATSDTRAALDGRYAPVASPTFTGNVIVPVGNAANEAAQISAYDATTGRLAIGGVEMGNTGWRNITSLVTAAPTYAASGLTITYAALRRVGNMCEFAIADGLQGASTGVKDLACTAGTFAGFRPNDYIPPTVVNIRARNSGISVGMLEPPYTNDTIRIVVDTIFTTNTTAYSLYGVKGAWPTSLPGTQATPPFTG